MNISEANAVQTLLDWLLDTGHLEQDEQIAAAADAAAFLAGRANRALHAGLTEADVRELWPATCGPDCTCTDDEPPPRPVETVSPAPAFL